MTSGVQRCWLTGILSVLVLNVAHDLSSGRIVSWALSKLVDRVECVTLRACKLGHYEAWHPGRTDNIADTWLDGASL
jgi:hypothetical protein